MKIDTYTANNFHLGQYRSNIFFYHLQIQSRRQNSYELKFIPYHQHFILQIKKQLLENLKILRNLLMINNQDESQVLQVESIKHGFSAINTCNVLFKNADTLKNEIF